MQASHTKAQFAYGDHWYDNPLGFKPLQLHTAMGFIIPAAAAGVCLLFTAKDKGVQNRISIYNETGLSWGYKYPYTYLTQNNSGVNWQIRKFMSLGIELGIYLPKDDFNKTTGFAVRPFARFYPVNTSKWKLYFESGGGIICFVEEFPKQTDRDDRLGTQWNGVTKYGLGSEIILGQKNSILFGVRHVHVSNGNKKGVERNPSHDSNGIFLGISHIL